MNRNDLDGLLALKIVAEKRSFRAAADELAVSSAAISKTIKQLERRLGVSLLTRTTRSTNLTEAGDRFLNQAGPGLDQVLLAIKNVGNYAEKVSGVLRLNLPRAIYQPFIEPLVASFSKKHPDVTIDLYFSDQTEDVIQNGFDAGIRHSDILAKDMTAVRISGPIRFVVAGSKKYLEKMGRPNAPKDLLTHNCLRFRFGNASVYERWEFGDRKRDIQVQVKGPLIMNDPLLLATAAVNGLGLIYSLEDTIRPELKSGKLETVLDNYAPSSEGYYLYYPNRTQQQTKLRAFVDHIRESQLKDKNRR